MNRERVAMANPYVVKFTCIQGNLSGCVLQVYTDDNWLQTNSEELAKF